MIGQNNFMLYQLHDSFTCITSMKFERSEVNIFYVAILIRPHIAQVLLTTQPMERRGCLIWRKQLVFVVQYIYPENGLNRKSCLLTQRTFFG